MLVDPYEIADLFVKAIKQTKKDIMKLLYRFVYTDIIRRLRKQGWGTQRINTVLTALGLPEVPKDERKRATFTVSDIQKMKDKGVFERVEKNWQNAPE